jgi:predicted XRE-type DNA-binding protein
MADLLGVKQSEVSHLMNGEFSRFSEGKLMNFLKRLDHEVVIQINKIERFTQGSQKSGIRGLVYRYKCYL